MFDEGQRERERKRGEGGREGARERLRPRAESSGKGVVWPITEDEGTLIKLQTS